MIERVPALLLASAMLVSVSGCGKKSGSGSSEAAKVQPVTPLPELPVEDVIPSAFFNVEFADLNPQKYTIKGTGQMSYLGDDFTVSLEMAKVPRSRSITQRVFNGRCPDAASDANGDGYIDLAEAIETLGHPIIDLDRNINTRTSGRGVFPVSDALGMYSYSQKGLLTRIREDVRKVLGPDAEISLGDSVVLIQGLPRSYTLPKTVASMDGKPAIETLPLACGRIREIIE